MDPAVGTDTLHHGAPYSEQQQRHKAKSFGKPPSKFVLPPIELRPALPPLRGLDQTRTKSQRPLSPKLMFFESYISGIPFTMSGYPYSNLYNQPPSGYATTSVPQYTQSQIDAYYQQYQCYPPQPYQVIPDYYPGYVQQPAFQPTPSQHYASYATLPGGVATTDMNKLAPPVDEESLRRSRSKSDRRSRSNSRTRTWTCEVPNCTSTANFTRLADLQRHQSTVHGMGAPEYPCYVPRCTRVADKGFTRRDHLVEHLRNFHHMDIPKRKPGERSANPLGLPPYPPQS